MPESAQAERPIVRHLRRLKRGVDGIMETGRDMCTCVGDVADPDTVECEYCRAWLDMAESVSEALGKYEERIGASNVDA